ncbi:MAG: hypothetical protein FJ045_02545, partial [Crenarchaeota archaeon]|nr:hypothetical protein [Thermoproteota archaeon]
LYSLLRQWREKLFNEIHGFNEKMKLSHIDEVIQRLFNRLIFIRTCEDRGIEERQLLAAAHQWETGGHRKEKLTEAVKAIFAHFNDTYDSELFEPHLLDSDKVFITEQTLRDMLTSLYDIPGGLASYDFSVIKPDVLGAVYEQYLGYVATKVKERAERQMKLGLTEDEAFVVTAKKEHRKEQGIYYTPAFVTDYIVRETVGRFIEEHSYNEIRNIKILDPACGSGSFLIRAYEELLEYHAKERSLPLSELQTSDRLTVLLNNIFGVDLDMQAVEIARLNLLLRTVTKKQRLPFIRDTIRQGNSLISGTPEELKGYFGDNWKAKKPFNWNEEFPEIMKNGGFDVVIGNPPYVTEQIDDAERAYYKLKYSESTVGKLNTYRLMMDKGIQLLKEGGLLGFIIPATCLTNRDSTALRELILDKCKIMNMLTIPEKAHIFDAVTQATAILVLQKTSDALERQKNFVSYFAGIMEPTQYVDAIPSHIEQATFQVIPDKMFVLPENKAVLKLIKRLDDASVKLSTLAEVYQGEVNLTNYKDAISDSKLDSDFAPLLRGINIDRYVLYPQDHKWVRKSEIRRQHAESDRIVTQEVSNMQQLRRLKATIAPKGYFCGHTTNYILLKTPDINLLFILGLLNSKVLDFYFKLFNSTNHLPAREIERLPIRKLDLSKPDEKKSCDAIRVLTDRMLDLNKKLAPIKDIFSNEREELVKEIEKTDKEIDNLVY